MSKTKIPYANYKAVIFDMDGTMVNNMAYHKLAWQKFLKIRGIVLTEEEFKRQISGKKNDQILEYVLKHKPDATTALVLGEEKEAIYRELYETDIKEVAGLTKFISDLVSREIKVAVATTAPKKNRKFVLKSLGLEGKFDVILGDEHVKHGKPHPEIFLATANELGVNPTDCLVFEDSPPGIKSAKSAGMDVVGILSSHSKEELRNADYFANNFAEIQLQ